MDSGGYTYICMNSGNRSYWLASNPVEVNIGDEIEYEGAVLMKDFRSATLDRTFPAILFVNRVLIRGKAKIPVERASSLPSGHPIVPGGQSVEPPVDPPEPGSIPGLPGGLTVAEIYAQKESLTGKTVKVIGKVMKINRNILGRNWVHLQDGTTHEGENDLVITSEDDFSIGGIVVAEGRLARDKNFQSGYFFPVLVEEATLAAPMASAHRK